MEWNATWEDPVTNYLKVFEELIEDQRTSETVRGIIGAGSLVWQCIATQSPELAKGKKGTQRVIRLATGEGTKLSELDAEHLTKRLQEVAVEQTPEDESCLIADCSDLRNPYAETIPYLMQVPSYRTLNVLGVTHGRRGFLYHRLFSSHAPDFVSEPAFLIRNDQK